MDDRFGFVILNYRTMDETMDCVKSIDEHIREAHEIVIVDNASPDGSGEKLRQVYDGRGDIKVIINADNLGYACGNNAGIKQARLDGCRYVVVLNQKNKGIASYSKNSFKVNIPEHSVKEYSITIKKSDISGKKADLRNTSIEIKGERVKL